MRDEGAHAKQLKYNRGQVTSVYGVAWGVMVVLPGTRSGGCGGDAVARGGRRCGAERYIETQVVPSTVTESKRAVVGSVVVVRKVPG